MATATVVAFSCVKESNEEINLPDGNSTVIATREGLDPATRTAVQPDGKSVWWSVGDRIMVFPGEGSTGSEFTSVETEESKTATFSGNVGSASTYYGVYPADGNPSVDADGKISVTVPGIQTAAAGSFDGAAFPTVAKSESLTMTFFNVAGGIKFALSEEGVSEILIKGNGGEDIAGTATVAFENGTPALKGISGGIKEVSVKPAGGGEFAPGSFYYAVLLPVSLPGGIDVTLRHSNGVPDSELVSTKARTIKRGTFGVLEGLNSITATGGKVRFYLQMDGSLRQGIGLGSSSLSSWTVSVNGSTYDVKTDAAGRNYIEVDEAADKKYEAALYKSASSKWYGASVSEDVIIPMSQFWGTTKANFDSYPMYASYSPQTGNILTFSDGVAALKLKLNGSASISSVKVRAVGGEPVSGKASAVDGVLSLTETVDWAVVNCTDNGSFVNLSATVPVIISAGTYSSGLEITICDSSHRMMQQTVYPGTLAAGQTYEATISWAPDSDLLFYEGFDNFVWGGDIMGGKGSFGYAPDADKIVMNEGLGRDGYAEAFTTVAYDYPGSGFIQPNTWNDVKENTVGTAYQVSNSYITSRNIGDWKYLYRCQEYHGAIGVGLTVNRGVVQLPQLGGIKGTTDAVISFRFCLKDGCTDDLYLQLLNAGHVKSLKIDGASADYTSKYYSTSSRNVISRNNVTIPASAAAPKEWHTCEVTAENLTDATAVYLAGNSTKSTDVHGFYLDEIKVTAIPGTSRKGTLRVLYWNIANGMWADQGNNFNNFVSWVKKYDPDVCVWCEAATIYSANGQNPPSPKYLPDGWPSLASRYGHSYTSLGGVIGGSWAYPQVVTSKYPLSTIKKITTTGNSSKPITRGAGMHRLNVNGTNIDFVTVHMWPFKYAYDVPSSQQSASTAENGGEKYREYEIGYIIDQTINNSEYSSTSNWILVGDFNSASPLDISTLGGNATDDKYRCQSAVLNQTDMQDVMKLMYKAEDFVASTYNEKDRKDYVYVSPALGGKVVNAFMANDSWTYVKKVQTAGGIDMPLPSDHRPIVVDINL